jgi:hypothetical protein
VEAAAGEFGGGGRRAVGREKAEGTEREIERRERSIEERDRRKKGRGWRGRRDLRRREKESEKRRSEADTEDDGMIFSETNTPFEEFP